ncbi:MAG: hypothetical protein K2X29_14825 [Candidatus Obscuribacterales bacterium]|nr:hypothetical protein [Candidatus Obscuribacterales bacterium]
MYNQLPDLETARLVLRLPDSRLLVRSKNGWEIYQPGDDDGFKLLVPETSSLEDAVTQASFGSARNGKYSCTLSLDELKQLGILVNRMIPGMALVWIAATEEWHVWLPPEGPDQDVSIAGCAPSPLDALRMAMSPYPVPNLD